MTAAANVYAFERDQYQWANAQVSRAPHVYRAQIIKQWQRKAQKNHVDANAWLRDVAQKIGDNKSEISASDDLLKKHAKHWRNESRRWLDLTSFYEPVLIKAGFDDAQIDALTKRYKTKGIIGRMLCERWWLRQLRKIHGRDIDQIGREIGLVRKSGQVYCTDVTVNQRRKRQSKNAALLEQMVAVCETTGEELTIAEIAERSIANPEIRRAELMVRIRGLQEIAEAKNWVGDFHTFTCPSKYHTQSGYAENKRYSVGLTPRDAQNHLNKTWQKIRAKLAREGVAYSAVRVAEPHADGCPHWHVLIFAARKDRYLIRQICRRYLLAVDGKEDGAAKRRHTVKSMNAGGAVGYVVKYIAKNIDGFGVGEDYETETPAAESAERVLAWASRWGIRQFQFSGAGTVGLWRELRRVRDASELDGWAGDALNAWRAADSSDFGAFIKYSSAVEIVRKYSDDVGVYGDERGWLPWGVACKETGEIVPTRTKKWVVDLRSAARNGGAAVEIDAPEEPQGGVFIIGVAGEQSAEKNQARNYGISRGGRGDTRTSDLLRSDERCCSNGEPESGILRSARKSERDSEIYAVGKASALGAPWSTVNNCTWPIIGEVESGERLGDIVKKMRAKPLIKNPEVWWWCEKHRDLDKNGCKKCQNETQG